MLVIKTGKQRISGNFETGMNFIRNNLAENYYKRYVDLQEVKQTEIFLSDSFF